MVSRRPPRLRWLRKARLWQHQHGPFGAAYTPHRRPVKLVWCGELETVAHAFALEKQCRDGGGPRGRRWSGGRTTGFSPSPAPVSTAEPIGWRRDARWRSLSTPEGLV